MPLAVKEERVLLRMTEGKVLYALIETLMDKHAEIHALDKTPSVLFVI